MDYKQAVIDLKLNRDPSQGSRSFRDPSRLAEASKVVSASPFRATVRLDQDQLADNQSEEDDDFERDVRSEMKRTHELHQSPIRDDSEVLRNQRDNYLSSFMQQRRNSDAMTNRSERIPQLDNNFTKPAYTISEVSPQRAIQVGGGQTGTSNQSEAQLSPVRRPWINDRTQSQPITAMNKFEARVDQDNEPVQIPTVNTQLTANRFRENSQNLRK